MSQPSKTSQAIAYFLANQDKGITRAEAAKQFSLNPTALYKALKVLAETADRRCPCCGQLVATEK